MSLPPGIIDPGDVVRCLECGGNHWTCLCPEPCVRAVPVELPPEPCAQADGDDGEDDDIPF